MKYLVILLSLIGSYSAQAQNFKTIDPNNIDIVRDKYGVPHIYGRTDAEAAYGLAWANAEDAFEVMQELLIVGKGKMGIFQGASGAEADFFRHVIGAEEIVAQRKNELPLDFLTYLNGYVQGINSFAASHSDRILIPKLFPVTDDDILISYVVAMSAMTDASGAMSKTYGGSLDEKEPMGLGSNAYAINADKSSDGKTYLSINPHLMMNGSFSFYEAHINSEEGLNFHGALFPGGTSIFMGCNEHLGWGMTWNYFDRGDIYKLEMHPKKKNHYLFDGEWKKLKNNKVWLKVKVGGIVVPVPKKSYISELGPVLKSSKSDDYYAFKYPAFMDIKAPYQWYKMDKAQNFEEFKDALDILGVGLFNIVYADKEGNIFYTTYGQIPLRSDEVADAKLLDGSKSENVWQRIRTLDELPQVENPESGYVYNTNNSPFLATALGQNDDRSTFPKHVDQRPGQNNRATVLSGFMESNAKVDYEGFQQIKFDNTYSPDSYLTKKISPFLSLDPSLYPDIADMLSLLNQWDYEADSLDIPAAIYMVSMDKIFKSKGFGDREFVLGFEMTEVEFVEAVRKAKAWFLEHYGTINVPLGRIFKAKKGDRTITSPGYPDALPANYGIEEDGVYYLEYGDTYTQFVQFDKSGVSDIKTLVPFGNSYDEESDYYFNQAPLFRDQKTKDMTLDKEEIYLNSVNIYQPK